MSIQLAGALKQLSGENSLKAWSVIITFFGDSVAPRGGAISTTTVQTVMATLNIGAGAVRTAFSRLAKDGWVTRQKVGRNTYYSLSDTGQASFSVAEAVIYAGPSTVGNVNTVNFFLVTGCPQKTKINDLNNNGIKVTKDSYLYTFLSPQQINNLHTAQALISTVKRADVPQWIVDKVAPPSVANHYKHLQKAADTISVNLPEDSLSALAIRTLLIHEWRRLLLRRDQSNSALLPADWPYQDCRQSVSNLYQLLSPAAESWLDTEALSPDGALVKSAIATPQRFG